jgi:hypothetical protein
MRDALIGWRSRPARRRVVGSFEAAGEYTAAFLRLVGGAADGTHEVQVGVEVGIAEFVHA